MKYLIIGTTAINRPVLHSDNIKEWLEWIDTIAKSDWDIIWFVNVDYIINLRFTYDETVENFKRLNLPRIKLIFLKQKQANFLHACQRISKKIKKYVESNNISVEDVKVFWMEDDWKLNVSIAKNINLELLLNNFLHKKHMINFTFIRNNYLWALAPSIISYDLFIELFYSGWDRQINDIDPEHCIGLYARELYGKPDDYVNITFINKKIDAGFFTQQFLNFKNSYHTFYNKAYFIGTNGERYMELNKLMSNNFPNKPVFIRLTPNMTIDGCNYARNFMETHANLKKTRKEEGGFTYVVQDGLDNKLNVVSLVNKDTYNNKMSRVRFHGLNKLTFYVNLTMWGIGWDRYNNEKTVTQNLSEIHVDFIECYKPLEFVEFNKVKIPKCLRYNEMWDEKWTLTEINSAKPDLVVCHHENDRQKYVTNLFKNVEYFTRFVHIPHCAEKTIFYDRKLRKSVDVLLCGSIGRHYPLRQRFKTILSKMPTEYICKIHQHPGYVNTDSHTDKYLNDFATAINQAKICLTCTSIYKYRLGKMVEIPACGSVLACDLPDQDQDELKDMMIVIDSKMTDQEIVDKLVYYLENANKLEEIRQKGLAWSQKYTQEYYAEKFYNEIKHTVEYKKKMFILSDDLGKIKWICDIFKDEFMAESKLQFVNDPSECDIIWLLAPWNKRKIPEKILKEKFVVTTIHHIDNDKFDEFKDYYKQIDNITNRYHVICPKTRDALRKITIKPIIEANFWINNQLYFKVETDKNVLRKKYGIPKTHYIIGSFQKDTEGNDGVSPKLSKGPDIFVQIIKDIKENGKVPFVILTGWRRTYIINKLKEMGVEYFYLEMVSLRELNELYNCLDLYIVSSRVEGGPRSIIECAINKTPIISTNVGICEMILAKESIYDMNDFLTYRNAKPNTEHAFLNAQKYIISDYMPKFVQTVFEEM